MAKQRKPWERLFDTMIIYRYPGEAFVPPTDNELDSLEMQLDTRLPYTYREFMKRFGPGELKGWVRIEPIAAKKRGHRRTVLDMTTASRQFASEPGHYSNGKWLSTLVYFASSGGGDQYAWDPAVVTSRRSYECQFYYLPRLREERPVPAGDTFWRFIAWANEEINSWPDAPEEERTRLDYRQWHLRPKKRPRKQDVETWLAWNNDTALSLARTVREQGRSDLFPILADALEDAGCDNADVLTSCRQGDPEIDGVWVLEVLLGKR